MTPELFQCFHVFKQEEFYLQVLPTSCGNTKANLASLALQIKSCKTVTSKTSDLNVAFY